MTGIKKDELLLLIREFEKVNEEINRGTVINTNALVQCQEQAVDLGNYIENVYSDTEELISKLESYCECLYQLSQLSKQRNTAESKKITKKVRKLLNALQYDICYKLPSDKKIVVFLPYKAAMWDSMESIYLAAKEDETCEVYVMPIPYFDKNADGSLGEMHDERNDFPENIPITSWQEFSLEENKPDIIYIHNPYDDWNLVTSIHPMFYAKKLIKFTKELVYVPYFVLQEIEPDNQKAVDRMKHFILTPGVVYADKVFVQSEKMKQIYVNEYIKWAEEQGLQGKHIDRDYQESRILGLGSPKMDKVLNTKREDCIIPEEWKKKIGDKKILLFNSSINAALYYGEHYLDKVEKVFRLLKDREDYILWWRPHPLLAATFDSMRQELSSRYERIVSEYKREDYGIYDDTADFNRAIAYSDRYYGDYSSMLQLYGATGKPALISIINQRMRTGEITGQKKIVNHWSTGDFEENDLVNWIEGKERWIIKRKFREIYKDLSFDGNNGSRIHQMCTGGEI